MAIRNIVKYDDPILRKISKPVTEITPRIVELLDDMADTLHKAEGVGLAAPQVGVLRRVVIVETEPGTLYELINPEIIARSEERQQEAEGCLSIPERCGITDRPMTVTVRATNRMGEQYEVTGSGLLARAFCHETDHLDGVLYIDHAVRMLDEDDDEDEDTDE